MAAIKNPTAAEPAGEHKAKYLILLYDDDGVMSISWRTKQGPATCRKIASCHQHLNRGMMGKPAVYKSLSIFQVVICNQWNSVKERAHEALVRYWMTSYSVGKATPKTQFSIGLHETSC